MKEGERPFFLFASFINPRDSCQIARNQTLPQGPVEQPASPEDCPGLPANFAIPPFAPDVLQWLRRASPRIYSTLGWTEDEWNYTDAYGYGYTDDGSWWSYDATGWAATDADAWAWAADAWSDGRTWGTDAYGAACVCVCACVSVGARAGRDAVPRALVCRFVVSVTAVAHPAV